MGWYMGKRCIRVLESVPHNTLFLFQTNDPVTNICHAADKQLFTLVEWAKRIPHFSDLTLEDQVILLRAGKGYRGSISQGPPESKVPSRPSLQGEDRSLKL